MKRERRAGPGGTVLRCMWGGGVNDLVSLPNGGVRLESGDTEYCRERGDRRDLYER